MSKPELKDKKSFGLRDCPEFPTYESGYLVSGNGTWRNKRPVVTLEACTGCLQCYLYCPDGAIAKLDPDADERGQAVSDMARGKATARPPVKMRTKVAIDCEFCKGCGICAKMCRFDALRMEVEPHDR